MRWKLLLVSAVVLGGCGEDPPKKPVGSAQAEKPAALDAKKAAAAAAKTNASPIGPMRWRAKPKLEQIPDGPVNGMANGQEFRTETVLIQPGYQGWTVAFHDKTLARPLGIISGSHHIDFHMDPADGTPAVGKIYSQDMTYGGGYWQVEKRVKAAEEGASKEGAARTGGRNTTTSWNTQNAYKLEITGWEVKPWDPKGPVFQDAGRASGRVIAMYKGTGDFVNSWVAGHFEGAIVRYRGKPFWVKAEEKAAERARVAAEKAAAEEAAKKKPRRRRRRRHR